MQTAMIFSHILAFITGGIVTLVAHCCLILGKKEDESIEKIEE